MESSFHVSEQESFFLSPYPLLISIFFHYSTFFVYYLSLDSSWILLEYIVSGSFLSAVRYTCCISRQIEDISGR